MGCGTRNDKAWGVAVTGAVVGRRGVCTVSAARFGRWRWSIPKPRYLLALYARYLVDKVVQSK